MIRKNDENMASPYLSIHSEKSSRLQSMYIRLFFCPFQKNSRPKKLKKSPPPKKLKGHFEQKNSVCWSQFEISAKKLWNFDHLKPILTDFMVKNETFKDFLIILAQNSCIWGEMFKILKKTLKILRKNSTIWKKTQCYGVFRTQCDSLKSVKKKACCRLKCCFLYGEKPLGMQTICIERICLYSLHEQENARFFKPPAAIFSPKNWILLPAEAQVNKGKAV